MDGSRDEWSQRYVIYAAAHGRSPADQLAQDRIDWPGGSMCGFLLWSRARRFDWAWAHRRSSNWIRTTAEDLGYDEWLRQWCIGGT